MTMTSGFITSSGLKLHYEIEGEGQPLVLLNGGPGLSHEYLQSSRVLASVAQLVFFDQRGTGQSDKANPKDYTVEANVEDVEQLRRQLQLDACILLGHSWGGMLAQAYVLKYAAHVSKLILANTFSSIADANATLRRMLDAVPSATRAIIDRYEQEGLYKDRDRYPAEYEAAAGVGYEPVFFSKPPPEYVRETLGKLAWDVYRAMWGEESDFKITGTLAAFDVAHQLHEIRVHTLVMVSRTDMPTVAMAQRTADLIPKARLEVFEHSRHFPFLDEPEKFFDVVRQFIQEEAK